MESCHGEEPPPVAGGLRAPQQPSIPSLYSFPSTWFFTFQRLHFLPTVHLPYKPYPTTSFYLNLLISQAPLPPFHPTLPPPRPQYIQSHHLPSFTLSFLTTCTYLRSPQHHTLLPSPTHPDSPLPTCTCPPFCSSPSIQENIPLLTNSFDICVIGRLSPNHRPPVTLNPVLCNRTDTFT